MNDKDLIIKNLTQDLIVARALLRVKEAELAVAAAKAEGSRKGNDVDVEFWKMWDKLVVMGTGWGEGKKELTTVRKGIE